MNWFGPSGDCGCCTTDECCAVKEVVSLDLVFTGDCCSWANGTYVLTEDDCVWTSTVDAVTQDNCNNFACYYDGFYYYEPETIAITLTQTATLITLEIVFTFSRWYGSAGDCTFDSIYSSNVTYSYESSDCSDTWTVTDSDATMPAGFSCGSSMTASITLADR